MIVKNEATIIERCLQAAKPVIDYVSICDTGSTDRTPEIIENWCMENEIPVTIHHEAFRNFGYNRSLSVALAQQTYADADYLLLLDADMILETKPHFDKASLQKDLYMLMQYNRQIQYWNTRLIKTSLPWKCIGVTHEYWGLDRERLEREQSGYVESRGKLDGLIIDDQEDGGSKSDKFERDKRLLVEGLHDQTTPPDLRSRYMFYLAQTYYCLNEFEEAIKWYKKRVEAGGWAEEVFYSMLQIGICYESLANRASCQRQQLQKTNEPADQAEIGSVTHPAEQWAALAILSYQNAWEYRPNRAEPLYFLARMFRNQSKHRIALMYALQGKEIPFPKDDILFVDFRVYDYLFDYEISICAFYVENKRQLGRAALQRLRAKSKQLPADIAQSVESNAKFY
ncbi:glycosyltransferase [Brevibacillus fluminis]|uniref:glycosyltransferase n=1 Tax=Brevibacillus fluminis TaxID=511487 RepID=UPI003F8A5271